MEIILHIQEYIDYNKKLSASKSIFALIRELAVDDFESHSKDITFKTS
jgi:hypothetical protein